MKRNEEQNEAKCNKKYPRFQNDEISPLRCEMTIKEDTIDTSTAPVISNIEGVLLNGTQLILEKVFNLIGFGAIDDDILKQLVRARLSQPMSKLATVDYLKAHFDEELNNYGLQIHRLSTLTESHLNLL